MMAARTANHLVFLLCIPAAFGLLFFYRPQRILLGFRFLAGASALHAGSFSIHHSARHGAIP